MIIVHIITGLNDGGAEGALYRLCVNDKNNCHYVVSLLNGGKYKIKFESSGIKTFSLELNNIFNVFTAIIKLNKILKEINPNIIQTWLYHADFFGGLVSYFSGYKNIYWNIRNCNISSDALKFTTRFIISINSYLSYFIPKVIISVSNNATKVHILKGFNKSKFINIPNGYIFEDATPFASDLLAIKNEKTFLIGMVARYDPQKDHENLFRSLDILRKWNIPFKCILVGHGMNQSNQELNDLIFKYSLDKFIVLLGQRDDVNSIMKILDLHVLSSLGEAFPNVLVEAMSNNTLCVSTNVGDVDTIIKDYGWVVPPRNPILFAEAIKNAFNKFETKKIEWNKLRQSAKKHVQDNFSILRMISNYNSVWNEKYK